MTRYADVYMRPAIGNVRCVDLRRSHFQELINRAPSAGEGRRLREACVGLLYALKQGDWLLGTQNFDLKTVRWEGEQDPGEDEEAGYVV